MKVTGVKTTQRVRDADASRGRLPASFCVVELATDAGLTGIAIADAGACAPARRLVADVLVGTDPRSVAGSWQRMVDALETGRGAKAQRRAVAALDQALWDLKAKANDEPLWKTLGGARPRANAYAGGAGPLPGNDELQAWYQRMARGHGMRGGELRVGMQESADRDRLERMRAALAEAAPEPVLMIDAGHGWSVQQAIERIRSLEGQFDLTWVEGVSRDADARGLKRLSDSVRCAVCVGRGFTTTGEYLPHLERRSADVVQLDINAIGITAALQVADAAFGLELPVTLSAAPGNVHAYLSGVMPYFMSAEIRDPGPLTRDFASDVRIVDGWAVAGDAPGNGLVPT